MTELERNSPYPFLPVLNRDKRGGTVQHIHDAIRNAIVRLEMPPGAPIDKAALCERLRVSRFPVSEALGRLAEDGFVEILPQRGTLDPAPPRRLTLVAEHRNVRSPRITERGHKQMHSHPLAGDRYRRFAEVDLQLLARIRFEPDRGRLCRQ